MSCMSYLHDPAVLLCWLEVLRFHGGFVQLVILFKQRQEKAKHALHIGCHRLVEVSPPLVRLQILGK